MEAKKKEEEEFEKNVMNNKFWTDLEEVEDFNDKLTELANYIARNVEATGVYIGKLEK